MYSDPPQNPNQGYQQYGYQPQPKKSGPGCWLWVPLGCIGTLFVLFIVIALLAHTAIRTGNKNMVGGGVMQGGVDVAEAKEKMKSINTQVNMYYRASGHYPATLQALVPQYIPDTKTLHLMSDPNASPAHISFSYTKPADNAPKSTVYLTTDVNYKFSMLGTSQNVNVALQTSLDGKIDEQRNQTSE